MRTVPRQALAFHRDLRGFTGAEKALLVCFALAIILLIGYLVQAGSGQAGGDARRVLSEAGGALGTFGRAGEIGVPSAKVQAVQSSPPPPRATPLPRGRPDRNYDGALTGADGRSYPRGTSLDQIPAVRPSSGAEPNGTILYVNGIGQSRSGHQNSLQQVADRTGAQVIGVYNATDGFVRDIVQSIGDKRDIGTNQAVDTTADTIYNSITSGKPIHLMGHSQGALIISRALTDVRNRLMVEDGMSRAQAERLLGMVKVETFGGAATYYPDGPQYVHYINRLDPVPVGFGLGPVGSIGAGRGAKIIRFNDANTSVRVGWRWPPISASSDPHGLNDVYLPRRRPFEEARR